MQQQTLVWVRFHDTHGWVQGEMINEAGTLTGGGGKPRGGRMCLGTAAPRAIDSREAASELATAQQQLEQQMQVEPHAMIDAFGQVMQQLRGPAHTWSSTVVLKSVVSEQQPC